MRRARRGHSLLDRKSFDETFRTVRLRNIRINYELNHEWEQLCREIWVRFTEIVSQLRLRRGVLFSSTKSNATFARRSRENEPYAHLRKAQNRVRSSCKNYVGWRPVHSEKVSTSIINDLFEHIDAYLSHELFYFENGKSQVSRKMHSSNFYYDIRISLVLVLRSDRLIFRGYCIWRQTDYSEFVQTDYSGLSYYRILYFYLILSSIW